MKRNFTVRFFSHCKHTLYGRDYFFRKIWTYRILIFVFDFGNIDARSTVVSAEIKPWSPKMSSTIFLVSFSFIPTLFFRWRLKFSPECLVQSVNLESGKLDFNAFTKAFSSSIPITKSFVLKSEDSISVPKMADKCVKNLWYV